MTEPSEPLEPAEPLEPVDAVEPLERRYPSTIGGAFYLVVLLIVGVAIWLVVAHDWRVGVRVLAGSLGVASVLRLLLPQRDAGMLAVRSRWIDVVMLGGVAVAMWWLTGSIPDQPGD